MLRIMMSVRFISLLAVVASADKYAITDMLQQEQGGSPMQQVPAQTGPQTGMTQQVAAPNNLGFAGNPSTATAGNAMASLLKGITGANMAGQGQPMQAAQGAPQSINGQVLSQDSMAVVSGLVEAFMHKVHLHPGERACLENNMRQISGDVMGTVGDIVVAVKALIAGKGTVAKGDTGGLVQSGLDSAMKITSLVGLSTQLVKSCVHGDALAMLNMTAQHLINGTYLERRFLANGIDIAHSLSDSIIAFEAKDFHRFGVDIGISLRKILLSKNHNATFLPEGVPEEVIIQKATDGLMRGFFVSGSAVEITDTAYPDVDVVINLHQCIAGNSAFFKEIWMATWDLIAQLSVNAQQHNLGAMFQAQPGQGQPKWSGELMIAMMQFPMALQRCGVSADMQNEFMEAVNSLNDVKVQFRMPHDQFTQKEGAAQDATYTTAKMAKAVEAWTNWDFERFGYELGELFRELLMLAIPEKYSGEFAAKYSLDTSGKLIRYAQTKAAGKAASISSSVAVIGGSAFSVLVAFAVVRTRRSAPQLRIDHENAILSDLEDCSDALEIE